MTRVHAADGSLLAEYARERRLYIPIQAVPKGVINAFIAAEDKNFYEHGGLDFSGIARAARDLRAEYGTGRRPQGASTITQQVAKNFLLTNELSLARKIKEALLAMKIERAFSKEKILELYLNEIYLGMGAYGVAAASLLYFDKSVHELTLAEAAYLAALPKAPNNYHPFRQRERAIERRNYVLDRMVEDRYITAQDAEKAKKEPLKVTQRPTGAHIFAAEYFAEEVRRYINDNYTEKKLYEGGLSVRTTLDPKLQVLARKVLVDGFVQVRRAAGLSRRRPASSTSAGDWGAKLAEVKALSDIAPWRLAVVLEDGDQSARIGLQPAREPGGARVQGARDRHGRARRREVGEGRRAARARARRRPRSRRCWSPATWSMSSRSPARKASSACARCPKCPARSSRWIRRPGACWRWSAASPTTRASSTARPRRCASPAPRSSRWSMPPRSTTAIRPRPWCWTRRSRSTPAAASGRRKTIRGKFYGPSTLRFGIEQSRNVMTVRLAQDIGMPLIGEYAKRFGIYDNLPPYLSFALGAGETTLLRMVAAYAMFDNGGRKIKPTLIDRIQDRYGRTIYQHDPRECRGCSAEKWANQNEPTLVDKRERVLDPMTAYQITSMMEGVVQRGTATVVKEVGKPIAGKTGTTNDEKDAWFIGFSPDLVVGVYLGYDKPRQLGRGADRRRAGGADRAGIHEGRARRQAGGAVPRAGRHQAHPHRSEERACGPARATSASSSKPSSPAPRRPTTIR